jgi:vancomycin resistance protein YoaR
MMSRRAMVVGSVGTALAGAAVALPASTSGQMYPNTRVNGIDISGSSVASAETVLRDALASLEVRALTYTFGALTWHVSLADLGMSIDYEAMIRQAMEHGRDGSIFDRYAALVTAGHERNIPLILETDEATLWALLQTIARDIQVPPRDARLEVRDGELAVVEHEVGRVLDVERAIDDTNRTVKAGKPVEVALATLPTEPQVTSVDLEGAREDALRLVSAPVGFTYDGLAYPVDVATLAAALTIGKNNTASLDPEAMAARLDAIAAAVYVPPQNVQLGWDSGLYVVEGDVEGVEVDREALTEAVQKLAGASKRTAALPVKPVKADARTDNIDELGLEEHIAYGSSSFAGSSAARAENVEVGSRNISYQLVAPGEAFSFNDLLGPITVENGFVEGKIIQGDWAASDLGGGVCQVTTTVFRAASNAGFQFTEWNPHSWRLAFYEADGSPPGYDSVIYQPNTPDEIEQDLRFTNPLDSWLLLMMVIDGDTVSAHFYGTSNGWTVELSEPRISPPKPIPEPVERVNPNLAPGERVLVQHAQAGVTVALHRTVTAADGSIVSDGDFVSDYHSVPEAWEVGPS